MEIIRQVWNAPVVNKNVMMGLMSGYISLGFVTFFICAIIELANPGSFKGVFLVGTGGATRLEGMLYYSFVTLLTIGYGDVIPVTSLAQKAALLTGLLGQFYTMIITAVIVSKYILHSKDN
jgi:voltage-gated potassium channel Kch